MWGGGGLMIRIRVFRVFLKVPLLRETTKSQRNHLKPEAFEAKKEELGQAIGEMFLSLEDRALQDLRSTR